jgi:hypothetical protein
MWTYAYSSGAAGALRVSDTLWHPPSVRGCRPILRIGQKCSTHFSKGALYVDHSIQSAKGPMTDKDGPSTMLGSERLPDLADLLAAEGFSLK